MPVVVKSLHDHPFLPSLGNPSAIQENRALHQDIRPLEILIINLMADKLGTERQLSSWLGRTILHVHLTFAATDSYIDSLKSGEHCPSHTSRDHIEKFYSRFKDVKMQKFDGVIVTGINAKEAELTKESMWPQIQEILDWSEDNTTMSLFLCWGAHAALKHFYNIQRVRSDKKVYGVYSHEIVSDKCGLMETFSDECSIPLSRWNEILKKDIESHSELELVALAPEAGVGIVAEPHPYEDGTKYYPKRLYVLTHPEYDTETLSNEYFRDLAKDPSTELPRHYFPKNDCQLKPKNTWRHMGYVYSQWLHLVYEATPFDRQLIPRPYCPIEKEMDQRLIA